MFDADKWQTETFWDDAKCWRFWSRRFCWHLCDRMDSALFRKGDLKKLISSAYNCYVSYPQKCIKQKLVMYPWRGPFPLWAHRGRWGGRENLFPIVHRARSIFGLLILLCLMECPAGASAEERGTTKRISLLGAGVLASKRNSFNLAGFVFVPSVSLEKPLRSW